MKYLYLLFRLFKCLHQYKILKGEQIIKREKLYAFKYFMKCSKCGKIIKTVVKN